MNQWKPTDAQNVVLHLVLSLACSAVLAGLVGGYQFLASNGTGFNLAEVWIVFVSGFTVAFAKGLVPLRNNPKVVEQAALDTLNQIQAAHPQLVQQAVQQVLALFQQQQQQQQQAASTATQQQPPVNITIHPAVPVQVTQQDGAGAGAAAQQKPLAVIPQRPQAPLVQQPTSNPQSLPVVDMAQLNTAQTPTATAVQAPALTQVQDFSVQRSWNNSQVMPAVQVGQS